jgi:hypothetical protein
MTPPIDFVALIADAVAERLDGRLKGGGTLKLVDREGACQLLSCSVDYFREQIEPHVPAVSLPSAGARREFKRWDVEDLKHFIETRKREPGGELRRAS